MKVTKQSEVKFIPVVITLETQEEVDIFISLTGSVTGSGPVRRCTNSAYDSLQPFASDVLIRGGKYFSGVLPINPY